MYWPTLPLDTTPTPSEPFAASVDPIQATFPNDKVLLTLKVINILD